MRLRLTDDERAALQDCADVEGISIEEVAQRAVREYIGRATHTERVADAATRVLGAHDSALDRLGN